MGLFSRAKVTTALRPRQGGRQRAHAVHSDSRHPKVQRTHAHKQTHARMRARKQTTEATRTLFRQIEPHLTHLVS